jgi:hypothetical protein
MSGTSVTLASFNTAEEAHLARNTLLNEDIDAYIVDENVVALDFRLQPALSGVKLMVRKEDAERALSVLKEILYKEEQQKKREKVLVLYSTWILCRLLLRIRNPSPIIRKHLLLAGIINFCVMSITILIVVTLILYT